MFKLRRAALLTCSVAITAVAFVGFEPMSASASQRVSVDSARAAARPAVTVPGTWNEVSTFNPTNPGNPDNSLNGVACASPTFCVTVGSSYNIDRQTYSQIGARWSGTSWDEDSGLTPSPSGTNSSLNAVSCVPVFCMAVGAIQSGSPYINEALISDGPSSWGFVPTPNPGAGTWGNSLIAVSCVSSSSCVAVDAYRPTGQSYRYDLMQWNGSTWLTPYPVPAGQVIYGVSCVSTTSGGATGPWCLAVGQDGDLSAMAYVLGGGTWGQVAVASPGTFQSGLNGVSCVSPTLCMAVGFQAYDPEYTPSQNDQFSQNLVEQWNGTTFSNVTVPDPNTIDGNQLESVDCFGPTSCVAGGYTYTDAGADTEDQVLAWNGSSWTNQTTPSTSSYDGINSITCLANQQCYAVGYSRAATQGLTAPLSLGGYYEVGSDGGVYAFGSAQFYGSTGGMTLNKPVVGMAVTPDGGGYWLVASDGGIFSYGDAQFYGSTGGMTLNKPVVGMAPTPNGGGYWLVASDGGIFSFGDALFYGSTGAITLNKPIVDMVSTPDGGGYWLVGSDGGIFCYGDALFYGSTGGVTLNKPIVDTAATPDGDGYWLVGSDGGIFSFGDALFYGSTAGVNLNKPIVDMAATSDGHGYWMVASDGGIFCYGDAPFDGSMGGQTLNAPIVAMAA